MRSVMHILIASALACASNAAVAQEQFSRAVAQGVDKGFTSCAAKLDPLVRFVNKTDTNYAHFAVWNKDTADDRVFTSFTSQPGGSVVASFSAVKSASGKCDVVMTEVVPAPQASCSKLRETVFKDWKYFSDLAGVPVLEETPGAASNVMLIPMTPTSCIIIKQFVGYYQ